MNAIKISFPAKILAFMSYAIALHVKAFFVDRMTFTYEEKNHIGIA